ncbi:MAG TPA: hypothetical protein PLP33_23685 [Leptospiraceae bacterium]|nr:hypothetical protein [Leptospiraceae bacterium]
MPLFNDDTPITTGLDVSSSEGILLYGSDGTNLARQLKTNANGNLTIEIVTASNGTSPIWITGSVTTVGGSSGGTGSLAPFSASLSGLRDLSGNIRAQTSDNSGATYVTFKEESTTGTLGALNAEVRLALSGSTSAGFQLAAGNLVGTLSAETSYDNGTTWIGTGFFDIDTKGLSDTIIFASANTAQTKGLMVPQGGGLIRVRVSAYTSGTANATLRVSNTAQQVTYVSLLDGRRSTYSGTTAAFTPAATATDVFIIQGSATKTIRVLKIQLYATQTTAGAASIFLIKRSTANTAGTAVATTKVPFDSTNPAATATVQHYTANPTVGTTVGNVQAYRGIIPAAASLINNPIITWTFGENSGQSVVLRGTTELLAINLNSVTINGGSLIARVEWTEE